MSLWLCQQTPSRALIWVDFLILVPTRRKTAENPRGLVLHESHNAESSHVPDTCQGVVLLLVTHLGSGNEHKNTNFFARSRARSARRGIYLIYYFTLPWFRKPAFFQILVNGVETHESDTAAVCRGS
jgi:hypothetical protein